MTLKEFKEKYKDKTVSGFEFSGSPGYTEDMHRYVGVDGLVIDFRDDGNVFQISFEDGEEWLYPAKECIRQIKENGKSEEEIYDDIYRLLKSI